MKNLIKLFLILSILILAETSAFSSDSIINIKDSFYWYNEAKYYTIYKKDYSKAMKCVDMALKHHKHNLKAKALKEWLEKKLKKEMPMPEPPKPVVTKPPEIIKKPKLSFEEKQKLIAEKELNKIKKDLHLRLGEDFLVRRKFQEAKAEFLKDLKENPDRIKSMFYIVKHTIDNGNWIKGVVLLNRMLDKITDKNGPSMETKEMIDYQLKLYQQAVFLDKGIKTVNRDLSTKKMAKQSYPWKLLLKDLPETSEIKIELKTLDKIDLALLKEKKAIPLKTDIDPREYYLDRDGKIYPRINFFREKHDIFLPRITKDHKIKKDVSKLLDQGDYYSSIGSYDRALKYYRDAKRLDPTSAMARNNIGVIYKLRGRLNEAISEFKAAISLEPSYSEPLNNLGIIYSEIGDLNEAIKLFNISCKLNKNDPRIYYNLGLVYEKKKNNKQAIKFYKEALELRPVFEAAMYRLGKIYLEKKYKKEALKYFKKLQKIIPRETEEYKDLLRLIISLEK